MLMPTSSASRAKSQLPLDNGPSISIPAQNRTCMCGPLEDHMVPEKYGTKHCPQKCGSMPSDSKQCLRKCTTMPSQKPGWPLAKNGWNTIKPCARKVLSEPSSLCEELECSLKVTSLKTCVKTRRGSEGNGASSVIPQGWPLLHQSMAACKLATPFAEARRMSVIEWALQLPERPKHLLKQHLGPTNHDRLFHPAMPNRQCCSDIPDSQAKQQEEVEGDFSTEVEKTCLEKLHRICKSKACMAFQVADLRKATDNFSKDNLIGKGGCSRVYRGVLSDGHVVAVKCLDISLASESENEFLTELEIASRLQHCHIIDLLGYCVDNNRRHLLVYNFASGGNLEQKLHHADGNALLPWSARYKIAIGVGEALDYIHNSVQSVIHRDVKSSNILLQSNLSPQLTDFGLSKRALKNSAFIICDDVVGTFGYIAPEYFMFGKVSHKTDVYSFGVVLLELITGKHPQGNLITWARPFLDDESRYGQVVDWRLGKKYEGDQLRHMLIAASLCLQHSPHSRPSMTKILKVLRGEQVDLEIRHNSMCKGSDDHYVAPTCGDHDIRRHLTIALYGVDDDMPSQACHSNPNKLIEEYLRHRHTRSNSFD